MRDLFLEAPFRTTSSEVGATISSSDHNRVNPKGPGDIRTNNTIASRSHLHEEVRTDYKLMQNMDGHHIIPANQKLMRYEDLKFHIAEVERCQKTHSDKVCPSSPFPGKSLRKWNTATQTRRSPTWEHYKQHRHPHLRCLPRPRIFISFAMISNNKLFHPDSRTLLAHIHKKFFFKGTWRLTKMAKWVLAEPTTDTVTAWDELISSCRITLFSDIPWNSNTWLSIAGITCLNR